MLFLFQNFLEIEYFYNFKDSFKRNYTYVNNFIYYYPPIVCLDIKTKFQENFMTSLASLFVKTLFQQVQIKKSKSCKVAISSLCHVAKNVFSSKMFTK